MIRSKNECKQTIEKLKALNTEIRKKKKEFQNLEDKVIKYYGKIFKSNQIIKQSKIFYNDIYNEGE